MSQPEWGADVCRAVFGDVDAADAVRHWINQHVGASHNVKLIASSMVAVFRADTEHHGAVAVRVHQPGSDQVRIARTNDVQRAAIAQGLPAPSPIVGPIALGNGTAVVESFMRTTAPLDNNWGDSVAIPMGHGLGKVAARGMDLGFDFHTFRSDDAKLVSHTSMFDFESTTAGAEWIEDYATRARAVLRSLPADRPVVSHRDWRLGNVDVADGKILAIYDWSSVESWPEAEAVGSSAVGFGAWHGQDGRKAGTPDEASTFIGAYERSVGYAFSVDQRRIAGASAVLHLAFVARCEHSVGWHGHPDLAQTSLRDFGEDLLRGIR